jgi:transcriptional regulator with XRE-family HTH domain
MTKIREERKKRGWTQIDLSYLSRVPAAEISRIESGKLRPSPGQLERLGRALGLRSDELTQGACEP